MTEEFKKANEWFGDGEQDIDLMIEMGVISQDFVLQVYRNQALQEQK